MRVSLPSGRIAWLVTAHDQVRQVLASPHVSSDRKHDNFPVRFQRPDPEQLERFRQFKPSLIGTDPPFHTRLRRSVITEFTVRRTKELRPRVQEIVDASIDDLLEAGKDGRPVDLVEKVSLPVPSMVICELLGVPYADHDFFQERTATLINFTRGPESGLAALDDLGAYFDELVARKEKAPTDDLIGRLIVAGRENGDHDPEELVGLAQLLLIAGHETTANMISLGTVALLDDPEQLRALREDPETLMPKAVEEMLRFFTIADSVTARTALADMEVGGVIIREGEGLIASGLAANRDPRAYPDPDALDITRNARNHVAFGYGIHQCLGQNLARMELEIVYRTLFDRVPGLTLAAEAESLHYKHDALVYGIREVPVTW
ncbi:cytochrome P450 [Phytomonospora sp. NPDC050363]|uniref:cytochrome P450 n=1 Tax=Phytomonospora sp. NPDC050363 TaxID=3155642 RepID=UPI0033D886BE